MIVVADTSVILNLCRIEHERLLPQLFGRVVVPEEVASEFCRLCAAEARFTGLALPTWIQVLASPQPMTPGDTGQNFVRLLAVRALGALRQARVRSIMA